MKKSITFLYLPFGVKQKQNFDFDQRHFEISSKLIQWLNSENTLILYNFSHFDVFLFEHIFFWIQDIF